MYFCGMVRRGFIILCLQLLSLSVFAQSDSVVYVAKKYDTADLKSGLTLHSYIYDESQAFKSNQQIFILEIPDNGEYSLEFVYEEKRTPTSTMALKSGAVAAVNGSFFDMDKHFPVCYLRIDSVEVGENTPGKDTVNRKYYQYGTICIDHDSVFILKTDSSRRWEERLPYRDIMTAGPLLIKDHELQYLRDDRTFVTMRHNRTALGILDDGTLLLVVADGRFKQAAGLTLFELQEFMDMLGCRDAINLDGGGSTTLFMNTDEAEGVVNYPSDNGRFDHEGERPVSNAIVVKRR